MNEGSEKDHLQIYLSIYQAFLPILSLFLGFILATAALVSFLEAPIELRRILLWLLLSSFLLMDFVLVRTHATVIEMLIKRKIPLLCPPWNDEILTIGIFVLSISFSFMLLIGGLTKYEAIIWGFLSVILAVWSYFRIRGAKKTGEENKILIVLKS
ncbi:MAG: hypothetical protein QXX51_00070 [Candidatus Bathyarchaeia archaeon]